MIMPNSRFVLLVEDDVVNQIVMRNLLQNEGWEYLLASNGVEAVELCHERRFDVVLMDVQMPLMDGLEATRIIREREMESGHHTPIVAVTAGVERNVCSAAGMDDYIAKPVRVDSLREVLSRVLCNA